MPSTGSGHPFLEVLVHSTAPHREQLEEGGRPGTHGTEQSPAELPPPSEAELITAAVYSVPGVERSRRARDNVSPVQRRPDRQRLR